MKRILFLLVLAGLVLSCHKDQDPKPLSDDVLHYDGPNQSAPVLARGISYPLVKFPASEIQRRRLSHSSLHEVEFYVDQRPEAIKILLFEWNNSMETEPGTLIYESEITNVNSNSWNRHTLRRALTLPAQGLWIVFEINAGDNDLRVIGCDPGPRHIYGDGYGLFGGTNAPGWTNFYDFSSQNVDINWNIRAFTK